VKTLKVLGIGVIALFAASFSMAATLAPLAIPTGIPPGYYVHVSCTAATFNADNSVSGTCDRRTASGSSGRGGHPTYTNAIYTASWDVNGNALTAAAYCGTFIVNYPYVHVWTYAPGFNASTCYLPVQGSTQVALYDPSRGYTDWWFYITTSANGAYELLTQGGSGYIYGF
jgi:hypothetical protein